MRFGTLAPLLLLLEFLFHLAALGFFRSRMRFCTLARLTRLTKLRFQFQPRRHVLRQVAAELFVPGLKRRDPSVEFRAPRQRFVIGTRLVRGGRSQILDRLTHERVRLPLGFGLCVRLLALTPFVRKLRLDIRERKRPLIRGLLLLFELRLQFFDMNAGLLPGHIRFPAFALDPRFQFRSREGVLVTALPFALESLFQLAQPGTEPGLSLHRCALLVRKLLRERGSDLYMLGDLLRECGPGFFMPGDLFDERGSRFLMTG